MISKSPNPGINSETSYLAGGRVYVVRTGAGGCGGGMRSSKMARSLLIGTGIYDSVTEGNVPKAHGHSIYEVLSDVN